jgi:CheY-like chemotaxis protein
VQLLHALVIDDEPYNIEVLERLLKLEGITTTSLVDASQLETLLETLLPVNLVFLDLAMPKINGYEVFEILQKLLPNPVPIIAYTVHLNEIETAREVGFHSFLGKPIDIERFPTYLTQILNGEHVWEVS